MSKFENIYQDAALMKKALLGEADETEQRELEKRLGKCPDLQKVYEQLQHGETLKVAFGEYRNYSSEQAYQSFLLKIEQLNPKEQKRRPLRTWWYATAAVAAVVVALSFYMSNYTAPEKAVGNTLIQPGTQLAQLTLPDGRMIDVDKKDVSVTVDGMQVNYKKGVLSYESAATTRQEKKQVEDQPAKINRLVIPRGGENTVILSDGTIVHLNAGSKLTYPVRFTKGPRMVQLEGEGYFQVKENKEQPFIVKTRWGEIVVHGTEFNVNAYDNEEVCRATLVKGSVSCVVPSQKPFMLSPGEQAVFADNGITKRSVDVEEYIGWVKGMYVFNDKPLEDIMQTFENWYNVQVYYETPALRHLTYSGNLKRYNTINTFLDALEMTDDIYYKINGRNILIYENE